MNYYLKLDPQFKAIFVIGMLVFGQLGFSDSLEIEFSVPSLKQDFEVINKINSGNNGTVYLAQSTSSSKQLALRLGSEAPYGSYSGDAPDHHPTTVYEKELEILSAPHSPHLVRVYKGKGPDLEGKNFIVIDYFPTSALEVFYSQILPPNKEGWLESYKKRIDWAFRMVMDISHGLEFLHSKGLVHLDVKPENMMMNGKQFVLIDVDGILTRTALSSSWFASFEVLELDYKRTPLSDLFSLGMSVIQVLSRYDDRFKQPKPPPNSIFELFSPKLFRKARQEEKLRRFTMDSIATPPSYRGRRNRSKALLEHVEQEFLPSLDFVTQQKFQILKAVTMALLETYPDEREIALRVLLTSQGLTRKNRTEAHIAKALHSYLKDKAQSWKEKNVNCKNSVGL